MQPEKQQEKTAEKQQEPLLLENEELAEKHR